MNGESVVILLVEDNEAHAELVSLSLKNNKVLNDLRHVTNGEDALAYLRHEPPFENASEHPRPHVILLDLRLPKIDGLEVLKEIKANEKLKMIPVVILTTSNAENDIVKAYEHNANSYLVKPVDFDQFNRMMKDLGFYWLVWNKPFEMGQ